MSFPAEQSLLVEFAVCVLHLLKEEVGLVFAVARWLFDSKFVYWRGHKFEDEGPGENGEATAEFTGTEIVLKSLLNEEHALFVEVNEVLRKARPVYRWKVFETSRCVVSSKGWKRHEEKWPHHL